MRMRFTRNPGVLVTGKGHEDYQQIGDLKHPFNDADEVAAALQELKHG